MIIPAIDTVQVPKTDPAWVNFVSGAGVGVLVPTEAEGEGVGVAAPPQIQLAEVTQDGLRQALT